VAATTNASGAVVERYFYNAYGVRTVKNSVGAILPKSEVGQVRGFTGYKLDAETALYFARSRMYSAKSGRFVSRDYLSQIEWFDSAIEVGVGKHEFRSTGLVDFNYPDGVSFYGAYMVPNKLDPNGTVCCNGVEYNPKNDCCKDGVIFKKSEGCPCGENKFNGEVSFAGGGQLACLRAFQAALAFCGKTFDPAHPCYNGCILAAGKLQNHCGSATSGIKPYNMLFSCCVPQ
jgi:RHS repeat-associated protein